MPTSDNGPPPKGRVNGDVVVRDAGPWSGTVLALLRHLESVGFAGAPRVVGTGFDDAGHETVSYLPGHSPDPHAWTDDAVYRAGQILRQAHEAAAGFATRSPVWQPWYPRDLPLATPVIGHCDTGPWNWVADDDMPYALIDWEYAGPVDADWELAQAAWLNAQLHDDDVAEFQGLPDAAARARQARLLVDGTASDATGAATWSGA